MTYRNTIVTMILLLWIVGASIVVMGQDRQGIDPTPTQELPSQLPNTDATIESPDPLDAIEIDRIFDLKDTEGLTVDRVLEILVEASVYLGLTTVFIVGVIKYVGSWVYTRFKNDVIEKIPAWQLRIVVGVTLLVVVAASNMVGRTVDVVTAINWFTQGFIPLLLTALGLFGGSQLLYDGSQRLKIPLLGYQRRDNLPNG
jgi:Flp pilus assembly pilin Flp